MVDRDTTDWRDALWTAHAPLFDGGLPFASGIGTLPVGWREVVESLCSRLAAVAPAETGRVRVLRLENDRAALNVAWEMIRPHGGVEAEAAEIVARATARSACTCEICGRTAARYRIGFSMFAVCPVHRRRGSIEIAPNWPTIRTTRAFVEGLSRIVGCEVYDRGLDRFVAAAPSALGIKDSP
ncbi:hypothetical protein [Bradyrhizobium diazoefficiens]|uniref:hypothetical protein n=1 Tax=Bradyrhizobium diazoefficiens TaxID=1355477 RepID=UPI000D726964|nr:hypothetical protein [Bradyrhizobium diazoefficiens]AWO87537.1 hypothetical protein DI395_02465 [Bradyrhizobium diazoefficiens]